MTYSLLAKGIRDSETVRILNRIRHALQKRISFDEAKKEIDALQSAFELFDIEKIGNFIIGEINPSFYIDGRISIELSEVLNEFFTSEYTDKKNRNSIYENVKTQISNLKNALYDDVNSSEIIEFLEKAISHISSFHHEADSGQQPLSTGL